VTLLYLSARISFYFGEYLNFRFYKVQNIIVKLRSAVKSINSNNCEIIIYNIGRAFVGRTKNVAGKKKKEEKHIFTGKLNILYFLLRTKKLFHISARF
jgi:hypothetical protein